MKRYFIVIMLALPAILSSQSVKLNWQKRILTGRNEFVTALSRMADGGFLVLSNRLSSPPDSSYLRWYDDTFKLRKEIAIPLRTRQFEPDELIQLASGKIGIAGSVHVGSSDTDFGWMLLDSLGQELGFRSFGGNGIDSPFRIIQSVDGTIYLAGRSNSGISGVKTEASRGGDDFWIVQIDESGEVLGQKTLGGNHYDYLANMLIEPDGSRLLWGRSLSKVSGDKTTPQLGGDDGWIIRTDHHWQSLSQGSTGGSSDDNISAQVYQYRDEFIFLCNDGQALTGGQRDIVLRSWDFDGSITPLKHVKANGHDVPVQMIRTCDGGYLLSATSRSGAGDDKSEDGYGGTDIWLIRMDKDFEIIWDKTIGGTLTESFPSLFRINQREYVLTFSSQSPRSGNLDEENPDQQRGLYVIGLTDGTVPDHWIARLLKGCHICGSTLKISVGDVTRFTAAIKAVDGSDPED